MDLGDPPDAEQRAQFEAAYKASQYSDAMRAYMVGLARRAIGLLAPEEIQISWAEEPTSSYEYAAGLATALGKYVDDLGDEASYRIIVARDVIGSLGRLQGLMENRLSTSTSPEDLLAELLLQAVAVGNAEVMLGHSEGGLLDEYASLKWRAELDRQRRSKGAESTNAKRADQHSKALQIAQQICKTNPALNTEELALRVRQRAALPQKLRTVSGWIGDWRRAGKLPELR